jgi:hypothetical protein
MDPEDSRRHELREIAAALKTTSGNDRFKLLTRMDDILEDPAMREWWDELSGVSPLENCGHPAAQASRRLSFVCPRSWEGLAETDSPNVRTCDLCRERVYLCETDDALLEHAEKRHCIALPIAYERARLEDAKREVIFAGRPRNIDYIKEYILRHPRS